MPAAKKAPKDTSWGGVAEWYDAMVEGPGGSFQTDLILPNLGRRMKIAKGDTVVDIACGQGFFCRAFFTAGATVIGADIAPELIAIATKKSPDISYHVAPSDKLNMLADGCADKITIISAIQNIERLNGTMAEAARLLAPKGRLYIVMNHPCFRVPKMSSWGWDEQFKVQYRRIDAYLGERKAAMQMHPGSDPSDMTVTFHRPLQSYVKALEKAGLAVCGLEEWNSHKVSDSGPRAAAENEARKQIPLFLFLEACKV